ncbi:hypothetical protein HWV62_30131 [Athelia sp. TMB]|nr:hypothetical protein HWV62_30131 [Athelia sp. TMB]
MQEPDERATYTEKVITTTLRISPDTGPETRQMLQELPPYSEETLSLLRLYGPRKYALVGEDPEAVSILNNQYAAEDQLLRRLRLVHALHTIDSMENHRDVKSLSASIAKVGGSLGSSISFLMSMHRMQRFTHPSLRLEAFRAAHDVAAPKYKPHPLGPSDLDRLTLVAAGSWKTMHFVPVLDTSIQRLNASLTTMNVDGWAEQIRSIELAQRKANDLKSDLLAGRV